MWGLQVSVLEFWSEKVPEGHFSQVTSFIEVPEGKQPLRTDWPKHIGSRLMAKVWKGNLDRQEVPPLTLTPKPGLQTVCFWHREQLYSTEVWQKRPGRHSQTRLALKEQGFFSTSSGSVMEKQRAKAEQTPAQRLWKQHRVLPPFTMAN